MKAGAFLLPFPPGEDRGERVLAAEQRVAGYFGVQSCEGMDDSCPFPHPDLLPEGEGKETYTFGSRLVYRFSPAHHMLQQPGPEPAASGFMTFSVAGNTP